MGFLQEFLGIAPSPAHPEPVEGPPAPLPVANPPRRGTAAWHRDRFANAIPQYRVMLDRGETTAERIAELERWQQYYAAIAAAEAGAGIPAAADDDAAQADREEEIPAWAPPPAAEGED